MYQVIVVTIMPHSTLLKAQWLKTIIFLVHVSAGQLQVHWSRWGLTGWLQTAGWLQVCSMCLSSSLTIWQTVASSPMVVMEMQVWSIKTHDDSWVIAQIWHSVTSAHFPPAKTNPTVKLKISVGWGRPLSLKEAAKSHGEWQGYREGWRLAQCWELQHCSLLVPDSHGKDSSGLPSEMIWLWPDLGILSQFILRKFWMSYFLKSFTSRIRVEFLPITF